ncbi:MAG: hypothetical protein KF724_06080 [Phycisphaeraceae bacterium]|nr:hypothetical protein [Phycisphaeraceae bacterium]
MRQLLVCLTAFMAALMCGERAPAQVLISEVRIDELGSAGNDDDREYYELRGTPGTPLKDLAYVVLGTRPIKTVSGIPYGGAGVIVHINTFPVNAVMPPTGRYLVRKPTMQLPLGIAANLTIPLTFDDDSTQTHLLVRNFNFGMFDDNIPPNVGFSPLGFDLDLTNNGVLDIVPWSEVVDSVSIIKSTAFGPLNRAYGTAKAGPAIDGIPAHVFRCGNNNNWRVGRKIYSVYEPVKISVEGPQQTGFQFGSPYSANVNGLVEAGGGVRVNVQLLADMDDPSKSAEVFVGGLSIGTLAGGYPPCITGTRTLFMSMDVFNSMICAQGSTLQVQVVPNANVGPCVGASCKVTFVYDGALLQTADSPGTPNPFCGCSCEYPNGSIEVVFVMDTSTSMADEAAALCAAIPQVIKALEASGTRVEATVLGITETPGGDFGCLTSNVAALLGPAVPDANGNTIGQLTHPESWGDAAAIVAKRFPWQPGFVRLVVTISDEAPFEGDAVPPAPACDLADLASVQNAIAVANVSSTVVSTLVGTGAQPCVAQLAALLASGTGGGTAETTLPASQLADIIANFLLDAASSYGCSSCVGDLNLDGVVNSVDLALYACVRGFACRDVNNDGAAGTPADDFLVQNFHTCGPADFCGVTQAPCLAVHPTPGCNDPACCAAVCAVDSICCTVGWDGVCVTLALQICGACGNAPFQQSCFSVSSEPGCDDDFCCAAVCAVAPPCCVVEWDSTCVAIARVLCLGCGSPLTSNCFLPNNTPYCDDPVCCAKVCANDPSCCDPAASWDVFCVALARTLCASCGDSKLWPCNELSFAPACADKECCQKVCQIDPFCCQVSWDQQCVERADQVCLLCGSLLAGSCCVKKATPFCNNKDCCETVCGFDPFCCSGSWDTICVSLATLTCPTLNCPCGTSTAGCFQAHVRTGCNNTLCCQLVCEWDSFCCLVQWDTLCANFAKSQCGTNGACVPGTGSCTTTHSTPGCDSPPSCCSIVCTFEPQCCTVAWDAICVETAFNVCSNCGNPDSGSCYSSSGSPGCADPICCNAVCTVDPFCCAIAWDGACSNLALTVCGNPIDACVPSNRAKRSCFMASPGRGCIDTQCCSLICSSVDSYCCEVEWDAICAFEAETFCKLPSNASGYWSCFISHCCESGPQCPIRCAACADRACAAAVCSYSPPCCTIRWDQACANIALAVCIDQQACPGSGPCNLASRFPGCDDPACCNAVCDFDPSCCITEWDASCVDLQRSVCIPKKVWNCPCEGGCFAPKSSPGCNNRSCCSAVCSVEENCCLVQWDALCASLARDLCCGNGLCGDPCNKSCLVVHPEPYCNDSHCCEAVCAADPFCCSDKWDTLCVQIAAVRCVGACGQSFSGNCFAANNSAGCSIASCCKVVCEVDPTCCQEEWDSSCAKLARTLPGCTKSRPKCNSASAGSCCEPHAGPACENGGCCFAVCAIDPTCCQEEWDELCVNTAKTLAQCKQCNPDCGDTCAGSCCTPHPGPRCNNQKCCDAVCLGWTDDNGTVYPGDAFCCNVQWDANCAERANSYAQILLRGGQVVPGPCFEPCPQPQCGSALAGDCCTPHSTPFCLNKTCCEIVCAIDPFCCQVSWDTSCATEALVNCPTCVTPQACGTGGSCFFPSFTPYCNDVFCCEAICAIDPSCCSVQWDFNCAIAAFTLCIFQPEPPVNDECSGALLMEVGVNPFTTFAATTSALPSPFVTCTGEPAAEFQFDVWYLFIPPSGGVWEVSTCNLAKFDTILGVYEPIDADCTTMTLRGCANNTPFCANLTSTVQWNGAVNTPYYIRVGSPVGVTGDGFVLIRKIGP